MNKRSLADKKGKRAKNEKGLRITGTEICVSQVEYADLMGGSDDALSWNANGWYTSTMSLVA